MFPLTLSRETSRLSGKQTCFPLLFPFKYFVIHPKDEQIKQTNEQTSLKEGFHLNDVFWPLNVAFIELSSSFFVLFKNPLLITQFYVLGFFVTFWVIFGYIWKEIAFLKDWLN